MLARRFLWLVAGITVLVLLGALAMRLWGTEFMRMTMVPGGAFQEGAPPAQNAYDIDSALIRFYRLHR